ncbi:leucyl/phenylalanyl-tRNA--protein transferase [Ramlibacter algicola]|uniref:Leucyl/phenylalanyl-tRNA--protein transferase n=1 Tax=Ramlibacter algicola TaxID=2795217 RepID=A0A934USA1_9BURK|nr:leucyl/phenylalanyl-tRNA--protein transferase [Ramlibacter algicola]MBK0393533.1 leucyl/phenylalanyl-tRNA--protein transferase [Ramlibacter algicola]
MKLPWLDPGDNFPPVAQAWDEDQPAPGLLAAGGALDVPTLERAYGAGIFPWFSEGQPILWWSTDPRMVLFTAEFRLHRSLRKTMQHFATSPTCEIRVDTAFARVIRSCASSPRDGQSGTWIVPDMVHAYEAFHAAGHAHSIETWIDGELAGGLYCVNLGRAVFGESMFTRRTDASKIALGALVAFCRVHGIDVIDCQQNTRHLASLGAREVPRAQFVADVARRVRLPAPQWKFDPVYWDALLPPSQKPA